MGLLLDRLYNLHWVSPDLARSAQPYLGLYRRFLKPHGFASIVNLRGENMDRSWWRQERRTAEALHLRHYDVRLSSRHLPAREQVAELTRVFETAPRPLLVKCSGGQDRSSFAAAVFLLLEGGAAARRAAEAQFSLWPYLHRPRANQTWMQHFPAFATEKANGTLFATWLKERYTPEDFAAWLAENGHGQSFVSLQKV